VNRLKYPIAIDGLVQMGVFLVLLILSLFFLPVLFVGLSGALFLWSIWFFRNPKREFFDENEAFVLSPADGQVVAVGPALEETFLKKEMTKVSVFMNVLNVHVNRSPLEAEVKEVTYKPGKFLMAHKSEASQVNEQNALLLRFRGVQLVLVQIAGKIARRIVSYALPGMILQRGQAFGLIKFGSRVDLYLPKEAQIKVKAGEKVVAGKTILAEIIL